MVTNENKGKAYKLVLSNLKACSDSDDIFHLIGLIASCESIMSDRLSAFLEGTNNTEYIKDKKGNKNGVSFGNLIKYSKIELEKELDPIKGVEKIETKNLYAEIFEWKEKRNDVIHSVCKSSSIITHKSQKVLFKEAKRTCISGYRLVRLLLKWSQKTKAEFNRDQKFKNK